MPQDSNQTDQDLLARLNALRTSSISLTESPISNPARNPAATSATTDDLAARFAKLIGASRSNVDDSSAKQSVQDVNDGQLETKPERNEEDDQTIEELLADLAPEDSWKLEEGKEERANSLMRDAKEALQKSSELRPASGEYEAANDETARTAPGTEKAEEAGNEREEPTLTEDQEADEIIEHLLAELTLEDRYKAIYNRRSTPVDDSETRSLSQSDVPVDAAVDEKPELSDGGGDDLVDLPAAPSTLLTSTMSSDDTFLPSAPATLPSGLAPAKTPSESTLSKYTDEEIETWCIICNANATVRCLGCDGDLYCGNCWNEGHRSPEAGFEERSHKASVFVKPGAGKKQAKRTSTRRLAA